MTLELDTPKLTANLHITSQILINAVVLTDTMLAKRKCGVERLRDAHRTESPAPVWQCPEAERIYLYSMQNVLKYVYISEVSDVKPVFISD